MKMLFFDLRKSEMEFFNDNDLKDFDIEFFEEPLNENTELSEEQLKETDVISVFITSSVTESVLKKFQNLRIIATRSTGYNHIDMKYCKQTRIAVFNVEGYGHSSVAQFTIMLMIAVVRNLKPAYLDVKRNSPDYSSFEGRNMETLSLGIIGYGSIGKSVAKLASAFGMKVYVNSLDSQCENNEGVEYVPFDELLSKSDIISFHLPYKSELYHMIGENEFRKMKDGVYIINTARGELLDSSALYDNVVSGKVKGAALDVFECEYLTVKDDVTSSLSEYDKQCVANALIAQKLMARDNVIITPHIAYNTKEAINTILKTTINNIRDYCKGLHTNQVY